MKLAAVGLATAVVGVVLGIPGLIGIGSFWVAMGLVVRSQAETFKSLKAKNVDGRTFARSTALLLAVGLPALVVGILGLGFPAEHADWRWLPVIVGGLAVGFGVLGGALFLAGSAVEAKTGADKAIVPATITIKAMRETGTYINERPRLEFDLLVMPDKSSGVTSYEVTKKATVPATALGSLRVGDGFKALVAGPESPTAMEIHWDQPVSGAADVSTRLEQLDRLHREAKISDEEYEIQRQRILGSL
ncbi:SHOCT domain-containing protein [Nocardioides speluncae]|uniref:SHOCT domain-containing protein n=1 Tax=Nocardioides speluncae TaxID=2670337 RepID=UPI0012B16FD5|nr:SHOCT domain-containing protein [Nocardioides speluncae]